MPKAPKWHFWVKKEKRRDARMSDKRGVQSMKKGRIAVIFQGIGYNADKPLLYYSKKIALERGYDVKVVEYNGIDKNCLENKNKMLEAFDLAVRQTEDQLKDTDFTSREDVISGS